MVQERDGRKKYKERWRKEDQADGYRHGEIMGNRNEETVTLSDVRMSCVSQSRQSSPDRNLTQTEQQRTQLKALQRQKRLTMSSMTPFEGYRYLHSAQLLCPVYLLSLLLSLYLSLPPFARSKYFYNGLSALSHCRKDVLDEQLSKEPSCPSSVVNESYLFRKV